jgi:hypothetical protein
MHFTSRAQIQPEGQRALRRGSALGAPAGEGSKNVVLLQQFTSAFGEVAVLGRPCDTAACFG